MKKETWYIEMIKSMRLFLARTMHFRKEVRYEGETYEFDITIRRMDDGK